MGVTFFFRSAYDVNVVDDGWNPNLFEVVSGNTSKSWEKLDVWEFLINLPTKKNLNKCFFFFFWEKLSLVLCVVVKFCHIHLSWRLRQRVYTTVHQLLLRFVSHLRVFFRFFFVLLWFYVVMILQNKIKGIM